MALKKVDKIPEDIMSQIMSGNISIKEFRKYTDLISNRCDYIIRFMYSKYPDTIGWWDFNNEGGEDGPNGYFDPFLYSKEVGITGDIRGNADLWSFPTRWIWEDFESECIEMSKEYKEWLKLEKSKEKDKKLKDKEIIKSALNKLTKEEKKILGIK